jgi:hypothetical protein
VTSNNYTQGGVATAALRDAAARLVRIQEALLDGEFDLAEHMLDDLEMDLADVLRAEGARCE